LEALLGANLDKGKNVDIKFNAHDAFLEKPPKIERLESQITKSV
jgi:hypothetical protein